MVRVRGELVMSDKTQDTSKTRRAIVKGAAKAALTAPAVVMLLSASTKPAEAVTVYRVIDDGTIT